MVIMRYLTAPYIGQRACGRSIDGDLNKNVGCSPVTFPVNTTYSQVCGIARGYQYATMDAFKAITGETIDQTYVDGLSITRGSPRQHLWTLAVGLREDFERGQACPRDLNFDNELDFVHG